MSDRHVPLEQQGDDRSKIGPADDDYLLEELAQVVAEQTSGQRGAIPEPEDLEVADLCLKLIKKINEHV